MASIDPAFPNPALAAGRSSVRWRRAAFAGLAAFILLGPAPGQLFGLHTMMLREWRMFAGAGVGLPQGQFTVHRAVGAVIMSPLEVAGLPSYLALPIDRRIAAPADLRAFAARLCDSLHETARLSFEGSVGTHEGRQALTVDDVCHVPLPAGHGGPSR
jgi:hypothetical protein